MKKSLLLLLALLPVLVYGQTFGPFLDSTTFTFSPYDTSAHHLSFSFSGSGSLAVDTVGCRLWQTGNTSKAGFTGSATSAYGIITDTSHVYPPNANDYFTLKLTNVANPTVMFWHKYQTDSTHAGGIVEFSTDSGSTWLNASDCPGMFTSNMYNNTDTLLSGIAAFRGTSAGQQLSKIEFLNCAAEKSTSATSCFPNMSLPFKMSIYIRFRFVSDTAVDSLSGWMIDSIRVATPSCGIGHVSSTEKESGFSVSPNPATSILNITSTANINTVVIYNIVGQAVLTAAPFKKQEQLDITRLNPGFYLIEINGEKRRFVKY